MTSLIIESYTLHATWWLLMQLTAVHMTSEENRCTPATSSSYMTAVYVPYGCSTVALLCNRASVQNIYIPTL